MAGVMGLPWTDLPGLGDEEYPGFPADEAPEEMPDILGHHSAMADVLKENPGIYESLRTTKTRLGVTFAKCIKTGMDNRGHPMIKSLGAVAGDAECFDTFAPLFDKLVASRHGDDRLQRSHSQSFGSRSLTTQSAEPLTGYVLSSQMRLSRNIRGLRFPPAASRDEHSEAERLLTQAFMTLDDSMKGEYFPLVGSQSYPPKPGGMSEQEEKALGDAGFLFYPPDSTAILSSGTGRHWPHARGIFVNKARTMTAWVNEEDHLRLSSLCAGGDLQTCYREVASVLDAVSKSLESSGVEGTDGFAKSDRLGFLNTSPVNIGTAMKASILGKLPLLKPMQEELNAWAKPRGLLVRNAVDENGLRLAGHVEVTNRDRLGVTEEESVNRVVEGMAELVMAERLMEQGMLAKEAF
jgi:creatine kinase